MPSSEIPWLPIVIVGLAAIANLAGTLWNLRLGRAVRSWPTARGTVTSAAVYRPFWAIGGRQSYRTRIAYAYTVNGYRYTGKNIGIGLEWHDRAVAEQIVASYLPGTTVAVYYDPRRPAYAFLEPERNTWTEYLFAAVVTWTTTAIMLSFVLIPRVAR
jgi:hypothetical protein